MLGLIATGFIIQVFITLRLIVLGFITLGHLVPGFTDVCKCIQELIFLGCNASGSLLQDFLLLIGHHTLLK